MYLKHLTINNYRKFGTQNNKVSFIDASSYNQTQKNIEINVASTTTLIVGKNNAGKSTVTSILNKIINEPSSFKALDFNISYLKENLELYKTNSKNYRPPYIEVIIIIGLDDNSDDLVTNYVPFMTLDSVDKEEIKITIKYEITDTLSFIKGLNDISRDYSKITDSEIFFHKYIKLINEEKFLLSYYDVNDEKVIDNFKIKNLIELKPINAITIKNDNSLSSAFSKIIEYRYKELIKGDKLIDLDKEIIKINSKLSEMIKDEHGDALNKTISKIVSSDKLKILLTSDLSFGKLFKDLIKYEYIDGENNIPENQFGLGYTNLVTIVAELIDYMEQYGESAFNSKVNLISIEEPETYMHPQMQEIFIKNINDAICFLLSSRGKKINTQLIITTHSSHILNSKIHNGNSFNDINYIVSRNGYANVIMLNDELVNPSGTKEDFEELKFLKKHIKFKTSDLFFSDAVIFVEGVTEDTLLKYFIENDNELRKYYITVFNIDGAHGLVYHKLIRLLKIPCLIITDIDIQRTESEKLETENQNVFKQVKSLKNRITTNKTIRKYNSKSKSDKKGRNIANISTHFKHDNLYIAFQNAIGEYYPTSFEEALILTNHDNLILNSAIKKVKPRIYKEIVGKPVNKENIKTNSYKLQVKLSKSKSDFANTLLYNIINKKNTDNDLVLPDYILKALKWLNDNIGEE